MRHYVFIDKEGDKHFVIAETLLDGDVITENGFESFYLMEVGLWWKEYQSQNGQWKDYY